MKSVTFKLTSEEFRKINLREMLNVRFADGERYLVELKRLDFLDNGDISVEGIGELLSDEEED